MATSPRPTAAFLARYPVPIELISALYRADDGERDRLLSALPEHARAGCRLLCRDGAASDPQSASGVHLRRGELGSGRGSHDRRKPIRAFTGRRSNGAQNGHADSQQTCEVKVDGAWRPVSLVEARSFYTMAPKRCPACHGQVIVAGSYIGAGRLSLQHRRAHSGCQLKPETYTGTPSLHPQALI
jgi:hypothetical protein